MMRQYLMMTAIVGAIFAASAALPNRADAMTIAAPAGMTNAVADVGQAEQVRWVCGWRGCWWRPSWYGSYAYWGWRRPGWGWGWRRGWW
jgi:hypothetical protein